MVGHDFFDIYLTTPRFKMNNKTIESLSIEA